MTTKPKRAKAVRKRGVSSDTMPDDNIVESADSSEPAIPKNARSIPTTSQKMLLSGLTAPLAVGTFYHFTFQHKTVATADSTLAGEIDVVLYPSKWAQATAEALWEYELKKPYTDPTTIEAMVEGWSCTLLSNSEADEEADEEAERISDSEAEAELEAEEESLEESLEES